MGLRVIKELGGNDLPGPTMVGAPVKVHLTVQSKKHPVFRVQSNDANDVGLDS